MKTNKIETYQLLYLVYLVINITCENNNFDVLVFELYYLMFSLTRIAKNYKFFELLKWNEKFLQRQSVHKEK